LACGSTPHLAMPMCHAILIILLNPLAMFQNTTSRRYLCRPWSDVSPNAFATLSSNTQTSYNSFSWVGHHNWTPQSFLLSNAIGCPSYMNTPLIMKSFTLMWTSNGLVKFGNFKLGADKSLSFKSSNAFYSCSLHLKDNSFLKKFESGFASCEKTFMNFQ